MKWFVCYGGGVGPDVWDGEKIIEADSLREALNQIEDDIKEVGGFVWSIEPFGAALDAALASNSQRRT